MLAILTARWGPTCQWSTLEAGGRLKEFPQGTITLVQCWTTTHSSVLVMVTMGNWAKEPPAILVVLAARWGPTCQWSTLEAGGRLKKFPQGAIILVQCWTTTHSSVLVVAPMGNWAKNPAAVLAILAARWGPTCQWSTLEAGGRLKEF